MRGRTPVSRDLGYGRSACDAGRDGRFIHQQARRAAGRKRQDVGVGQPAAGASGYGSEWELASRFGDSAI